MAIWPTVIAPPFSCLLVTISSDRCWTASDLPINDDSQSERAESRQSAKLNSNHSFIQESSPPHLLSDFKLLLQSRLKSVLGMLLWRTPISHNIEASDRWSEGRWLSRVTCQGRDILGSEWAVGSWRWSGEKKKSKDLNDSDEDHTVMSSPVRPGVQWLVPNLVQRKDNGIPWWQWSLSAG